MFDTDAISFAPGALLGYRKDGTPFYVIAGGAEDDSDFDTKMGEDDNEETDEDEETDDVDEKEEEKETKTDPKKKLTPEQEEVVRLKKRLASTRKESAARRIRIAELERKTEEEKDNSETAKEAREAREQGRAEAEKEFKPKLNNLAGRTALLEAGAKPGKVKRALKLLDYDDVEVDDDGSVIGLEDAIDELRAEWPELFTSEDEASAPSTPAPKTSSKDVNGAGRRSAKGVDKPKTSTEVAYERLMGTGRR